MTTEIPDNPRTHQRLNALLSLIVESLAGALLAALIVEYGNDSCKVDQHIITMCEKLKREPVVN